MRHLCVKPYRHQPGAPSGAYSRGSFMLELLIGIAILAVVLATVAVIMSRNTDTRLDQTEAEVMAAAKNIFSQYVLAHRPQLLEALRSVPVNTAAQQHCVVRANPNNPINPGSTPGAAGPNGTLARNGSMRTCAFDLTLMQAKGFHPRSATVVRTRPADQGGNFRFIGILRLIDSTCTGTTDCALEMVVAQMPEGNLGGMQSAQARRMNERAIRQSQVLGAAGGVIPFGDVGFCSATNSAINACGNGWSVDMVNFINTAQLTAVRNAVSPPPSGDIRLPVQEPGPIDVDIPPPIIPPPIGDPLH